MNKKNSRTQNSVYNIITSIGGQIVSICISFIARLIFIRCLSKEYLGLSGVFTNVLSMLSLVELGIGPAITYALYRPLSVGDTDKISGLMRLYKRTYLLIGSTLLCLGILFTPFYRYFITTDVDIQNLDVIYILYVVNMAISYFYSYKRALIEASQKTYLCNIIHILVNILLNITQIIILIFTHNYIIYMIIQVSCTWIENIIISKIAEKKYPFLNEKKVQILPEEEIKEIKRNVKALIMHRIGGVVVNSTDNLLLSKFIGLSTAGIYANYSLVTSSADLLVGRVFGAVAASIGDLNVSCDVKVIRNVYNRLIFGGFWLCGWITIGLFCLLQPFICLFFGEDYMFNSLTVVMLCLVFYTSELRKPILIYKDTSGLYYKDWFKPCIEVIVNLTVSLIGLRYLGSAGIFFGTLISNLTVSSWIEAYIVHKNILSLPFVHYLVDYIRYTLVIAIVGTFTYLLCLLLPSKGILFFLCKLLVVAVVPNISFAIIYRKSELFIYYINLVKTIVKRILTIAN